MSTAADNAEKLLEEYVSKIQVMPVDDILPADYNPREDLVPGDPDFEALQRSIVEFDQLEPLVYNTTTNRLVGGHQRLAVLKHLGRENAVVFIIQTDDEREKALNLALNKAIGRWDATKLMSLVDSMSPSMLNLGGFESRDEAYELMRAVETGESTNFLDAIMRGTIDDDDGDDAGGGNGGGSGGGGGGDGAPEKERRREIDLKEDHVHRTGIQYFDVILQLTAEQRAIFYQAVNRAKKHWSTDNTFEAVVYILDEFNKKWDQDHPGENGPEDLT